MYHPHFGLTKNLFSDGIALDTAVYLSPQYNRLIASFKVALTSPSSVIVLTGPAGVGKTTLTSTALRASTTRLAIAWLNGTPTNGSELLELLLIELGIATLRTSRIERLQLWRQFQSEMSTTASRLFVVAERTEDLSAEVLRALDSLTSPDAAGNTGANVVLLGQPGLEQHLGASSLDALRQRIRLKAQLEPFTEPELQDYLRHQVACTGGRFDTVFAPGVVGALYRHSGGIARLANNLCETALTLAATELEKTLTVATLTNAAAMLGLAETAPTPTAASAPAKPTAATPAAEAAEPALRAEPIVVAPPPAAARVEVKLAARPTPAPVAGATPAPLLTTPVAPPAAARPIPPPPAAPAPAPAPVAAVQASVAVLPPVVAAPPTPPRAPAAAIEIEFDGEAADVPDLLISDFPILTDAVEMPATPSITPPRTPTAPPAAAKPAAAPTPAAAPRLANVAPAPTPARPAAATGAPPAAAPTPPPKRLETAYSTPKAAAPPKPAAPATASAPKPAASPPTIAPPAAAAAPVAAKPAPAAATSVPRKPALSDDEDLLRQTQTMRAIAVAKSIDDVSDSMAETLFGDAELDLLTAAMNSSVNWDDDAPGVATPKPQSSVSPPKPAVAAPVKSAPAAKPAAAPTPKPAQSDDLLDLLGLSDAPLELMDDPTLPPTAPSHKTAAQR